MICSIRKGDCPEDDGRSEQSNDELIGHGHFERQRLFISCKSLLYKRFLCFFSCS